MTNTAKRYLRWVRILIVLLTSGGFLLLSLYGKAWTEHNVFPMLFPAVVLSAWLGGRFGGLIATFALAIGTAYYHLPPAGIGVEDAADVIRLGTFTLSGAFVAWLSGALRESQGILMATLQSIGDGVIATDRRGRIRFLNPVAEMLTGWRQSEAKGRPLTEVFRTIDDETRQTVNVPPPLALREAVLLENACLISKNGQQVAVDDSLAPVHIESGRLFGTILVFRDATKRKQAEAALLDSQRRQLQGQRMEALGRLAGGVAHDFNNLLTVIAGYADLALKQIGEDNPARKGIEEIRKAGDRASSLTRQLLIFGRGQPTRLEVVDLSRIVINFEQMLRRLIVEDIELVANLVKDPVPVKVDVGQIEQVIMNLVVNARDAMPRSGRITIETGVKQLPEDDPIAQAGGLGTLYAFLSVADTGVGIDDQVRARLFEPFFTTKEVGRGTGLGLSVIYGIVRSHHGHLRLHSETGRGSVFEVYLPLTEELPESAQEPPAAQNGPRTKATILLVEDSPEVRMLMRDILANLGYLVLEAGNGQEAIRVAKDHPERIDLLVTDIVMPELGGIELAERLLQNRPQLRVLYVSGYADQETANRALGALSVAYLQKPFSFTELARKVESMISAGDKSSDRGS